MTRGEMFVNKLKKFLIQIGGSMHTVWEIEIYSHTALSKAV